MRDLRDLASVDLNLLVTFQALYETQHVTRAATLLGVSQPALSHALKRLRELLGDDVFVQTPKGMIATERSKNLAPVVKELLQRIDLNVLQGKEWNLATSRRTFRIQSTDLMEHLALPRLIGLIEKEAPETAISFTTSRFSLPKEELESGATDLAVAGFFGELPSGFYRQKVFSDHFRVGFRAKHPRLGKKSSIKLDELCRENHLILAPGGTLSGQLDILLEKKGMSRRVVAGLSTFSGSGGLLAKSDCVLVGPSKMFALYASHWDIKTLELPLEISPIQVVQVWHERNHRDPHHRWLREQVKEILGGGP